LVEIHLPVASQDSRNIYPPVITWAYIHLPVGLSNFSKNRLWYETLVIKKKKLKVKRTDQTTASPLAGYIVKTINLFQSFERAGTHNSFDF
jgi:hypothetical protein